MKKKITIVLAALGAVSMLAACQTSSTTSSSSSSTSSDDGAPANKDHYNDTYAGYECDLNGDGIIGSDERNLTWANSYDKLIAKIKATSGDEDLRFRLMHAAETELMSTWALCPLYYYTDLFLKNTGMTGYFGMPLGYKFFYGAQVNGSGAFKVCLASAPKTIDPSLNNTVDGGTYDEHLFEGLYRWQYTGTYPNGAATLTEGLAKGETKTENSDGTVTYVYTLRDGLKWSNGEDLTAADIVRSWKRAVSKDVASPYNYLFEAIEGGSKAETESDGHSLGATATDNTHLTVTLTNKITYWHELLAFPTFSPVPSTADAGGSWAAYTNTSKFVCNGSMMVKAYDSTKLELEPNPYYYNTDMVKATDVTFAFSSDDSATLTSYENGDYAFIQSFPIAQIDTLKAERPSEFFDVGQLGTYYLGWNINSTKFDAKLDTEGKRAAFRHALCLLINRDYLVKSVTKGGQLPANGFVSKGLTGPNGAGDWTDSNGPQEDGAGWYDTSASAYAYNKAEAINLLQNVCGYNYDASAGKFTDIPSFDYIYNTNDTHKVIAQFLQAEFAQVGVTMTISNEEWATFVATRQAGDYVLARNGWLCDYNDPMSMLDMWLSTSGNNDSRFGRSTEKDS